MQQICFVNDVLIEDKKLLTQKHSIRKRYKRIEREIQYTLQKIDTAGSFRKKSF